MNRRLQDRVHELCSRALLARSQDELHTILQDLRAALHEHRNSICAQTRQPKTRALPEQLCRFKYFALAFNAVLLRLYSLTGLAPLVRN